MEKFNRATGLKQCSKAVSGIPAAGLVVVVVVVEDVVVGPIVFVVVVGKAVVVSDLVVDVFEVVLAEDCTSLEKDNLLLRGENVNSCL